MLTEAEALRAYARMLNVSDTGGLEPLLAENFVYESQMVLGPLETKQDFLTYMEGKLDTIRGSQAKVYAEMGTVRAFGKERPCVVLAQHDPDRIMCVVLAETDGDRLKRLDLCIVPPPSTAVRTGEYPM